jgi:hypothetical protein
MTNLTSAKEGYLNGNHANLVKVLQLILGNPDSFYGENPFSSVSYTFQGFVKLVKGGLEVGENVSPYGSSNLDEFLGISVEEYQTLTEFDAVAQVEAAISQILAGNTVRVPYHLDPEDYKRDRMVGGFVDALKFGCSLDSPHWGDIEIEDFDALRAYVDAAVSTFIGHLTHSDILQARQWASWEKLGADIYFTVAGHGSGFWDGDYNHEEDPTLGHRLTEAAKLCGISGVDLYEGDDGKIYAWGL